MYGRTRIITFGLEGSEGPSFKVTSHHSGLTTVLSLICLTCFHFGATSVLPKRTQTKPKAVQQANWQAKLLAGMLALASLWQSKYVPPDTCHLSVRTPFSNHSLSFMNTAPVWRLIQQRRGKIYEHCIT